MKVKAKILFISLLIVFSGFQSVISQSKIQRLKEQIEYVSKDAKGIVGVAVKHIESGEELYINDDVYFPMASVFKVPILVEVLYQVKEGNLSLNGEIEIKKTEQHLGSGLIAKLDVPGIKLSIKNLINLMMMISDNSATDILLTKVGTDSVNKRMRELGIKSIIINRTCQHLILDYIGLDYEKYKNYSASEFRKLFQNIKNEEFKKIQQKARKRFNTELKDVSTPRAMNTLLEKIFTKKIINENYCELIISTMLKCDTGRNRLKGLLPSGTKVAHKTGTIGGTVNDAGIIYLPYNLGHIAITVFTKETEAKQKEVENVIARISKLVYDYFLFTLE